MRLQKSWLKEEFVGCGQAGCPIFKELLLWTWEVTSFLTLYSRSQPVMGTSIRVWKALLCFSITGISNSSWVSILEHFLLLQWCIKRTKDRKQCPHKQKRPNYLRPSAQSRRSSEMKLMCGTAWQSLCSDAQVSLPWTAWRAAWEYEHSPHNSPLLLPCLLFLISSFFFLNAITIKFPLDSYTSGSQESKALEKSKTHFLEGWVRRLWVQG